MAKDAEQPYDDDWLSTKATERFPYLSLAERGLGLLSNILIVTWVKVA